MGLDMFYWGDPTLEGTVNWTMQGSNVSCSGAKVALVWNPRHVNPMWECDDVKSNETSDFDGFYWSCLVIPVNIATLW